MEKSANRHPMPNMLMSVHFRAAVCESHWCEWAMGRVGGGGGE